MKKTQILICIFMAVLSNSLSGENLKFRTVSPSGGFSYNGVTGIKQDDEGFIWILMDEELYRFDGYNYKRYSTYFREIDPANEWSFDNLTVDKHGKLYVNTNKGLFSYDKISDEFSQVWDKTAEIIVVDPQNQLWVRKNFIWYILNPQTQALSSPTVDGKISRDFSLTNFTYNDDFYLLSYHGEIYRYDKSSKTLKLCSRLPGKSQRVKAAYPYRGKLWLLLNKSSLYKLDLATFNLEEKYDITKDNSQLEGRSYYFDKNGNFWIGTIHGLFVFNTKTKKTIHYLHSPANRFSLPNNSIWTINEDKQNNVWIGTYSGFVCYVNLDEKPAFTTIFPEKNKLNHAPVSAFAEDDQSLWVGTEGGGVNRIDKETGKFSYINEKREGLQVSSGNIKSITVDRTGKIWIGTFKGGIDCYNKDSRKLLNLSRQRSENSLRNNDIRKIILESDSGLWIAYQQTKLEFSYYSLQTGQFKHFNFSKQFKDAYIYDILKGRNNQLWVLTKKVLFLFDLQTQKLREVKINSNKTLNFNTLCLDDSGNLWIGTLGNGLVKYNPNSNKITLYSEFLQSNLYSIFNICYDVAGYLWMGTDNGLVSFNLKNKHFSRYSESDGVQGQVYYPLATMRGQDGKLYFGGTKGFTIVDSREISPNQFKPKVIISELLIDNKPTNLKLKNSRTIPKLRLNYTQNNFGFKFSSDNFLIPEKVRFKYRLKGYDDRWIEVGADNRSAYYSKVPAGTYYFEVMASNNDGVWNDLPTRIMIVCTSAPWRSWPAYTLYSLILLTIAILIHRYFKEKKKLEMQIYLDQVEKDKQEEIHQSQLRFFTNISHDFRTPLSLILAALDRLRLEGIKEYYYKILSSNSQRLLNLVNELMDFRTLENGQMSLKIVKLDINEFVREIGSDFFDFAKQRNIGFNIVCDDKLVGELYADKNILEKIIMNLLNNAFKHTKEGGQIVLETHSEPFMSTYENQYLIRSEQSSEPFFYITVRDTGTGISKDSIHYVFERFYKDNTNSLSKDNSTGIGLALVKSLVLLHKGMAGVFSEKGKGSDFVVSLPKYRNNYEITEIDHEKEVCDNEINTSESQLMKPEEIEFSMPQKIKKKILLVEDNEELRKIVAEYLSQDFEVLEAVDGMDATSILSKRNIDLIISDIMMPRKDGITFCKEVKNNTETSHIPVILLTAKTSVESKLEGADSGADIYFEKPLSLDLLKKSLFNIFRQNYQLKEYYARNHYAESAELSSNERDAEFLKDFVDIIEQNLHQSEMDVNYIATELNMSRSKLYRKIRSMTDMSIVEFILNYKLKKAAKLLIEENKSMREIMDVIGIESQPYFTNAFKKKFGVTPGAFSIKHKKTDLSANSGKIKDE